jgi:choline-sulfatase
MTRRRIIIPLFIVLCAAAAFMIFSGKEGKEGKEGAEVKSEEGKYNLVIIVSDALRADGLGCYGGNTATPNLDQLAKQGVLFEHARCAAPWTSPSAVTLFTGNYASAYPMEKEAVKGSDRFRIRYHVPDDELLFSEALAGLDYEVMMSTENPYASLHNNVQGFEKLKRFKHIREETRAEVERKTGFRHFEGTRYEEMYGLLDYLLKVPADRNFCVLKWFSDPHAPYDPPDEFKSRIRLDTSALPEEASFYSTILNADNFQIDHGREMTGPEQAYLKALYDREIESMDERVGYILDTLKQRGLLERTIILFTSDHGEHFGEHGLFCHSNSYYEELLRVPLILCGPGIAAGKRVGEPVLLVDLIPTLKDLMQVAYPGRMQGQSFEGLLHGREVKRRPHYFTGVKQGYACVDSLLEAPFKLVVKMEEDLALYDLSLDPAEAMDISEEKVVKTGALYKSLLKIRKYNDYLNKLNAGKKSGSGLGAEEDQEIVNELKALGYL